MWPRPPATRSLCDSKCLHGQSGAGHQHHGGLIERLQVDKMLRRLCGFSPFKKLPNESTFSRVFAQLAERRLLERVRAELITSQLGDQLIGHISRDG